MSLAVVLVISAGTAIDYWREYKQNLRAVLTSLEEQAQAIRLGHERIPDPRQYAEYVNQFCARMNESISPGHHILILGPEGRILASSHYHSGREMESALRSSDSSNQVIHVGGHEAVQSRLQDSDGSVIVVAQYLDHMKQVLRGQLLNRTVTAAVAAGVLIFLVVFAMNRWVLVPLAGLKAAAGAWSMRDFVARAKPSGPRDLRDLTVEFNGMAAELERHEREHLAEMDKSAGRAATSRPTMSPLSAWKCFPRQVRRPARMPLPLTTVLRLTEELVRSS